MLRRRSVDPLQDGLYDNLLPRLPGPKKHRRLDSVARSYLAGQCKALKLADTAHDMVSKGCIAFKGIHANTPNVLKLQLVKDFTCDTQSPLARSVGQTHRCNVGAS
jgi:hypothetical protein